MLQREQLNIIQGVILKMFSFFPTFYGDMYAIKKGYGYF